MASIEFETSLSDRVAGVDLLDARFDAPECLTFVLFSDTLRYVANRQTSESANMLNLLLVEDNDSLRQALAAGLEASGALRVVYGCASGEAALAYCLEASDEAPDMSKDLTHLPNVILMDVQLAGELNGIQAAMAIRREYPRMPVVFYSIQDDDVYYRDFRRSGILSHYAYVRKSNYLLPHMIVPLLRDAVAGRGFIDPDIESRVQEVRHKDEQSPMALLEPNEQIVAHMLAQGMTNEQIAARLGFRDKRTISRTNGQIYAAWGLNETSTDEKVARTRAALIVHEERLIRWDEEGVGWIMDERGQWLSWQDTLEDRKSEAAL
jgi:DNA-binding NarL/FixJ family response regulator